MEVAGEPALTDVLIVEDDVDAAKATAALVEVLGASTRIVGNARDVLHQIRHAPPDAMLLDLHLPGIDGFALLDELDRSGVGDLEVIAISGVYMDAVARKRLRSRGVRLMPKPFGLNELSRALGVHADRRRSSAALVVSGAFTLAPPTRCKLSALVLAGGTCVQGTLAEVSSQECRIVADEFPWVAGDDVRVRCVLPTEGSRPWRLAIDGRVAWVRELMPRIWEAGVVPLECTPPGGLGELPSRLRDG
jgi:CheY-like chemotaxis protein